jgi:hypothetical protein
MIVEAILVPEGMIRCLVFSKNRAMQVEATLESFFRHCADVENVRTSVLFACSDEQYRRQYQQLAQEWQGARLVRFVPQSRFRQDVFNILNPYGEAPLENSVYKILMRLPPRVVRQTGYPILAPVGSPFILFLVDDTVFTHEFALGELTTCLSLHQDALGFSLRLGRNTTYCYMNDRPQEIPPFHPLGGNVHKFDWTKGDQDFGYPFEVSSSVYRLTDVLPALLRTKFDNPNLLEGGLSLCKDQFAMVRPFLLCYGQSAAFCNAINLVQTASPNNRAGSKPSYSVSELAGLFDAGHRIRIEAYDGLVPTSCHQEIDLVLEKRAASR